MGEYGEDERDSCRDQCSRHRRFTHLLTVLAASERRRYRWAQELQAARVQYGTPNLFRSTTRKNEIKDLV